jgi:hypothetical protein
VIVDEGHYEPAPETQPSVGNSRFTRSSSSGFEQ